MDRTFRSGLYRRNFISTHDNDIPMDTLSLVSPINRFAIFHGNFNHDHDDYPQKPWKRKTKILVASLGVLIFVSALSGYLVASSDYNAMRRAMNPPDPVEPLELSTSKLRIFQKAAVCTDAPQCSEVGHDILNQNGSAVDATVAAMFCNGLLNHQSMGLGGGFFMTVYIKNEEKAYSVIAREKAPGAATVDMFQGNHDKSTKGPLAVAVPGELRGLWTAHKRWGKLPWSTVVAPAVNICREGFIMSEHMQLSISQAPYIKNDPMLQKMYMNPSTGKFYQAGAVIKPSPMLCNTLERIAAKGGDELYNGSLAVTFVEDLQRAGSIITADDLRSYEAKVTEAIVVPFGDGDTLFTPPPPSSGVILANILNILNGYNFNSSSINTTEDQILTYHRIVEAFKYAYATRTKLGDLDFLDLNELIMNATSPEFGAEIRLRINDTMTSNDTATYGAEQFTKSDHGTAHISIIGTNGDAVSITSSINYYFGAGFSSAKTGIVLNNVMDDFSSPGITNMFGLKPSPANFIAPGKRPLSSMTPSIIVDKYGNAKLVIGASGGTKITTAVALVIMRTLWFNQNIKDAVDAPRIHHQIFPMTLEYQYGVTQNIINGLRAKGHGMARYMTPGSIVCGLYRNSTAIYANADYRKKGDVTGIN